MISAIGRRIWNALTSLKLTLGCLWLLMVLVAGCTLAQVHQGTLQAVGTYMRSLFVWWPIAGRSWSIPVLPAGALVGLLLIVNLVATAWKRFEWRARKAGIWLVHAGVILLLVGEFVTAMGQVQMQLAIEEGQTLDYLESPREVELAVIDASEPTHHGIHAVPDSRLARGGTIEIPGTPLSLRVRGYIRNAVFVPRREPDPSPRATAGVGQNVAARERAPVTADDEIDHRAVWVELLAAGESRGTFLVSNALKAIQSFDDGGRTWALQMRPVREYLPYSLTLSDFRHDSYAGTDIPKNFSSLVHLSNPSRKEARDVLISMNQPLRYEGKTFYQSSFGKADTLSVIQVVENPGWLLPYIAIVLIAMGLVLHFGLGLLRARPRSDASGPANQRTGVKSLAFVACVLALGVAALRLAHPGPVAGFDLEGFGRLPVLEGGRTKPIDSLARNALLQIRGRQSLSFEGQTIGADPWLLDLMFRPGLANGQPVFFVDDPEVLGMMGVAQSSERYFSFDAIAAHVDPIEKQAQAALRINERQRTRFQTAVTNLYDRLNLYFRLQNTVQLARTVGLAAELAALQGPGAAERHQSLTQLAYFRPLPPERGQSADAWKNVGEALAEAASGATPVPGLPAWARLGQAWAAQDAQGFNSAVLELTQMAESRQPGALRRAGLELVFNRAEPFYAGIVIYVLALLVLFASWLWKPALLQGAAFGLLAAGALVHTAGLVCRIVIQGRPPVTNLYSSAVFVGWAAVVLGLVLERLYRRGVGAAVAAAAGFASLIIAHHLTGDGDTMEMMRAVLDTNFWLATHVVAITLGYGGTFLAGALALGYTFWRHLAPKQDATSAKSLASMTYGVICFALMFSFIGTILGGIWADQSWGRFWGWDPKENGALLIVLWNAIILHARWGGYVAEKGIMTMAIFGNVVTSLSWFGVNMLGVGLHTYGFMEKTFWALFAFVASQLVLAALSMLPRGFWRVQLAGATRATRLRASPSREVPENAR